MTPAQLVTQVLSIPTHERARIVEACAVLAPYMPILEALGGVEAAASALSVETPTISGRPCDRCGVVIEGRDNRTKFCEDCSREMKRERGLRSNMARDERVRQRQGQGRPTAQTRAEKASSAARDALLALKVGS